MKDLSVKETGRNTANGEPTGSGPGAFLEPPLLLLDRSISSVFPRPGPFPYDPCP